MIYQLMTMGEMAFVRASSEIEARKIAALEMADESWEDHAATSCVLVPEAGEAKLIACFDDDWM